MLAIGVDVLSFELLVGSQDRAQRVEDVLASFPSGPALAERGGHLEYPGDDPPLLVGRVESESEVNRCGHGPSVTVPVPGLAAPGDRGRRAGLADQTSLLPETEDAILGGIVFLATRQVIAGDTEKLPELLPDLVDFTLGPYLGAARAAELARESPGC